jgi:hypothetical protein
MRTPEAVRLIQDPEKRLAAAHQAYVEARTRLKDARQRRAVAGVALRYQPGRTQASVLRELAVSRALYVRWERRWAEEARAVDNPERAASQATKDLEKWSAVASEMREIRDDVVDDMLNGGLRRRDGARFRNADVARITGLTTARVAQMRTGGR